MKPIIILSKNNTFSGILNTKDDFYQLFLKENYKVLISDKNFEIIKISKKNSTKLKQMIHNYYEIPTMKVDKKTKGSFPNYDNYETSHTTYKCPKCNCNIHLDWHEKRNFCAECGVKLDWSEIKND